MKLSTKGRYGVRLMLDLAVRYGEGPVLLRDIARREEISDKYLSNLVTPLKAMGLIETTRGIHGGYVLAKDPSAIMMKEIVEALEGSLSLVDCVDKTAACDRTTVCIARDLWSEVALAMGKVLEKYTLADMVSLQRAKRESAAPDNYTI